MRRQQELAATDGAIRRDELVTHEQAWRILRIVAEVMARTGRFRRFTSGGAIQYLVPRGRT